MFTKKPKTQSGLEIAIDTVLSEMQGYEADADEYAAMVDQLDKLYKLKEIDKPERVSKETLALIAANLLGIILILGHEQTNVVTSKALNFVFKPSMN